MENSNNKGYLSNIILSCIMVIVCLSMLVATTFAWFSDDAVLKNSKLMTGNLAIELLATQEYIESLDNPDIVIEDLPIYTRSFDDGNSVNNEQYYLISDAPLRAIEIYRIEPGEIIPASFKVANYGDLAVEYSPFFVNVESKTGLETLDIQYEKELIDLNDYNLRHAALLDTQTYNGVDVGGHLEDILKVYVGSDPSEDIIESNYIGTVKEIMDGYGKFGNHYLLPRKDVVDTNGIIRNVDVLIYDDDGNEIVSRKKEKISELGDLNFFIVMPKEADKKYENAYIKLDVGVRATQTDYEFDGTNRMIYDDSASKLYDGALPSVGDLVTIEGLDAQLRVLSVQGNKVKFACLTPLGTGDLLNSNQSSRLLNTNLYKKAYRGSTIDNYLNYDWYNELPENIRNAMTLDCIHMDSYDIVDSDPLYEITDGTNSFGLSYGDLDNTVGFRHVYPLCISDLFTTLNTSGVCTYSDFSSFFNNSSTNINDVTFLDYADSKNNNSNDVISIKYEGGVLNTAISKDYKNINGTIIPVFTLDFERGISFSLVS